MNLNLHQNPEACIKTLTIYIERLTMRIILFTRPDRTAEADPVLSAWMYYDNFKRGLEDVPFVYEKKVAKLKALQRWTKQAQHT